MKKKFLHIILGMTTVLISSSLYAAETNSVTISYNTKAYVSPEAEAEVSLNVFEGETFNLIEESDHFYGIEVDDELVYIYKDDAMVEEEEEVVEEIVEEVKEEAKEEVTPVQEKEEVKQAPVVQKVDKGQQVVDYAKQFIGTPYVSGGNSLKSGVDCSGFTQQVYLNFGVKLQRSSRSQYASNGYSVKKSELQPGDLVFYGYSNVSHVAIYVGNNKVIHSPVPGKSVCIAPLWQRGDANIIGCKRIFN